MKKQELISIEEQMYARGIWKRPDIKRWEFNVLCDVSFNGIKCGKKNVTITGDLIEDASTR